MVNRSWKVSWSERRPQLGAGEYRHVAGQEEEGAPGFGTQDDGGEGGVLPVFGSSCAGAAPRHQYRDGAQAERAVQQAAPRRDDATG